jgi:hypothetical protein
MKETVEGAEVPKVPIEATETTSVGAGGINNLISGAPTATMGLPSPPPTHCHTVSSRHRCSDMNGRKGRDPRRFRALRSSSESRGSVPPNNKGSVVRTAATAVEAEFFEHERLSPFVEQNGAGHLAVVSSADEMQCTTVGRRGCAMASAFLRTAVEDGRRELLHGPQHQ